jgi:hypothetical protein
MQRFERPTKVRYTHIYHLFETSPLTEQPSFLYVCMSGSQYAVSQGFLI